MKRVCGEFKVLVLGEWGAWGAAVPEDHLAEFVGVGCRGVQGDFAGRGCTGT